MKSCKQWDIYPIISTGAEFLPSTGSSPNEMIFTTGATDQTAKKCGKQIQILRAGASA